MVIVMTHAIMWYYKNTCKWKRIEAIEFFLSTHHTTMTSLSLLLPLHPPLHNHRRQLLFLRGQRRPTSSLPPLRQQQLRLTSTRNKSSLITAAGYITGPASDAIVAAEDPKVEESDSSPEPVQRFNAISLGLLLRLLSRHKLRVAASIVSLVCCTTCTLSMPILSGK